MSTSFQQDRQFRTYTGLTYLLITILISIGGNILFQGMLFPVFPDPVYISMVSGMFPVLFSFLVVRKSYTLVLWRRYAIVTPFMVLNALLSSILYNLSLSLTTMSAVTVITSMSTLFTMIFSRFILKTPIVLQTLFAVHLSIVGAILVVFSSSEEKLYSLFVNESVFVVKNDDDKSSNRHIMGCICALLSSACSGLTPVLIEKFEIIKSDLYLTISGIFGIIFFLFYFVFFSSNDSTMLLSSWNICFLLTLNGLLSSILGYYFYIKSLKRLSSLTVNVLWTISIPLSVIIDYYRGLIHTITSTFIVGAFVVVLATALIPIEQDQPTNTVSTDAYLARHEYSPISQ